jgi:AraC-like DNA-binding protein
MRPDTAPHPRDTQRDIHARPDIGLTARVIQGNELRIASVHLERNALIVVDKGIKTVTTGDGVRVRATPGQALVVRGAQTVDFTNVLASDGTYEARWLIFDDALLLDERYRRDATSAGRAAAERQSVVAIGKVGGQFHASFEAAREALSPVDLVPEGVARLRVLEVAYWLLARGVALAPHAARTSVAARIRHLIAADVDASWPSAIVSGRLAMSEATLRRRLSAEGTSLTEVVADVRMTTALTMLQATSRPISDVAMSVGYESPSRFSVRFRERFGFSPSAVRDLDRGDRSERGA